MFELSVKGHFSAAHHLQDYPGSCATLHGHNWSVEVTVRGEQLDACGLLIDFRELKQTVREALEILDHADLNAVPDLQGMNPTSEHIARYLHRRLGDRLNNERYRVWRVAVDETPESRAVYWDSEEHESPNT